MHSELKRRIMALKASRESHLIVWEDPNTEMFKVEGLTMTKDEFNKWMLTVPDSTTVHVITWLKEYPPEMKLRKATFKGSNGEVSD